MNNTLTATVTQDCKRFRCPPGWYRSRSDSTSLNDQELWLVWAGRGTMQTKNLELDLHPGVCVWMRPGHIYDAKQHDTDTLGLTYIHFSLNGDPDPKHHYPEFYELWDLSYIDSITRRITDIMEKKDPTPALQHAADSLLTGLLLDLVTSHERRDKSQPSPALPRHQRLLMQDIARYIHDTVDFSLTVSELARKAGYSLAHFSSLFRQVTGQTVESMIIRARIEKAQQLLRWSDLSVGQISDTIGYRDIYFFSRQFKAKTGQTPSEYRAAFEGEK